MTSELNTDVLIIGGGPAGIQASRMIRAQAPETDVTVLRPEPHSVIYCALPYAIEGLVPLEQTLKSDSLLTDVGVRLLRQCATKVEPDAHRVVLDDDRVIRYRQLLIATGARPFRPPVPGIDLENVMTIKTVADTERVLKRVEKPGFKAVVVGAGAIGIEQATAYQARGAEVHLVEMREHLLPNLVDADMTGPLEDELRALGVIMHMGKGLTRIEGTREAERVILSDGTSIDLTPDRDLVMISVGMAPDIGFVDDGDFEIKPDGLVVDEHMRTTVPDVWAAGDCVAFRSGIDGEPLGGKLATNAVPMAKIAAHDMLGRPAMYPGFFNGAATVVGRWRVAGTGFTAGFAAFRGLDVFTTLGKTSTRFPMMPDAGEVTVKLVVERDSLRIIGGQIVGSEAVAERIDVITLAIQQKMTARDLAAMSYSAQPWQTFFPARNAIVEAAQEAVKVEESLVEQGAK